VNSRLSKDPESYRTAAIFFSVGGLIFIISSVVSGKVGALLPVGIAFIVLSIAFWQHSKKLRDS